MCYVINVSYVVDIIYWYMYGGGVFWDYMGGKVRGVVYVDVVVVREGGSKFVYCEFFSRYVARWVGYGVFG